MLKLGKLYRSSSTLLVGDVRKHKVFPAYSIFLLLKVESYRNALGGESTKLVVLTENGIDFLDYYSKTWDQHMEELS